MSFNELPEFSKEFNQLAKKYKSLPGDLEVFKRVIAIVPLGNGKHFNVITKNNQCAIVKARLFCRYLKGSTKLRIIYAYHAEPLSFCFLEIYFKGKKENEDRDRIKLYLENI
ncbi:hypothetical protein KJ562_00065 [Patescibacteria group bacterium]|nr:hypothetical protein [Patescibacteria group bacterium]